MNSLISKLDSIIPQLHIEASASEDVAGLTAGEMAHLLSKVLQTQGIAIISITYPSVDARNHRSLDSLVHKLLAHGFGDVADLIRGDVPFLLFDDLSKCMRVHHEIQLDSVAISGQLFYAGEHGMAAERAIDALLHRADKPELSHVA
ncbi:hypothetical protein [Paraburkholderia sp. J41]|uniref:hypothetical protein n=1 Tax=Paraburkholderia sp. J41 TaxID=2805433 RepID=UPI002AC3371F|nr:hypothetical protein [Paraburkholderia sp. J41]